MEDFTLALVDVDTRKVVRRFAGHTAAITDTTLSADSRFDLSSVEQEQEQGSKSLGLTSFTQFGAALGQAQTTADHLSMLSSLLELGPSALDLEIRSLGVEGGGTLGLMRQFLAMLRAGLDANTNFEAVQSWLGLFLKVHGETVAQEEILIKELELLEAMQEEQWRTLKQELDSCLCLVNFFKSSFL